MPSAPSVCSDSIQCTDSIMFVQVVVWSMTFMMLMEPPTELAAPCTLFFASLPVSVMPCQFKAFSISCRWCNIMEERGYSALQDNISAGHIVALC
jgi:hypothetical protein